MKLASHPDPSGPLDGHIQVRHERHPGTMPG